VSEASNSSQGQVGHSPTTTASLSETTAARDI
jgi:hypothetical protein